jgi:hypothetical protein
MSENCLKMSLLRNRKRDKRVLDSDNMNTLFLHETVRMSKIATSGQGRNIKWKKEKGNTVCDAFLTNKFKENDEKE